MMLIGVVTGVLGSICNQEGFSQKDVVSAALGLGLGFTVTIIFVLCSGSLISKVVRRGRLLMKIYKTRKMNGMKLAGGLMTFITISILRLILMGIIKVSILIVLVLVVLECRLWLSSYVMQA